MLYNTIPQLLSFKLSKKLADAVDELQKFDHPNGPYTNHGSQHFSCHCPLCLPEMIPTDDLFQQSDLKNIYPRFYNTLNLVFSEIQKKVSGYLDAHCINRLKKGACHQPHVDSDPWWKIIILLRKPKFGGKFFVANRCENCACLSGQLCHPQEQRVIELSVGDACIIAVGEICHGVSQVEEGERLTLCLRYNDCPTVFPN